MKNILLVLIVMTTFFKGMNSQILPQTKEPLNVDYLWKMKRIGSFDISKDGKTIAFTVTTYNFDDNKGNTDIYLINSDGTNIRPFKNSIQNESEPKFSPDGTQIAYIKDNQIWLANLNDENEIQLTNLSTGTSGIVWSNDGKKMLFVSSVYPDCENDDCNKQKDEAKEKSKVKAKIIDDLMFRHWNEWRDEKRSHLFLLDIESKEAIDLNLFSKYDVPPIALGSSKDYCFSPDNSEIAFTMNESDNIEISTNNDIFLIDLNSVKKGIKTPFKKISISEGNDNQPVYSPDGKYIAFCSMERAGFEADKQRLMLYDRKNGSIKNLTDNFDRSVNEIIWSQDSKNIYFNAYNEIYHSIYKIEINSGKISNILNEHYNINLNISQDGSKIFFTQQRTNLPYEIFSINNEGKDLKQITFINKDLVEKLEMNDLETFWCDGAENAKVQSIIVKPPFFDSTKKYPMIFLIHGGPQGSWNDDFHYRWNLQLFASKGYVVVAPNPRGSVGYGQKFTDEISGDWGGKVYTDLMNAYDYAIKNFSFIDKNNTFAAGASYGGYMINWIAGHTDRFNALVSHAGVFNVESMYGTTEELWFPEWEFKGTPWTNRSIYEKWSPHRYIQNCKTPMLIIHGANDFRVPEGQAFELFTSLQRLGVESKLLYFPDEFHFVNKPQNAKLWWDTIFEWFEKHKK